MTKVVVEPKEEPERVLAAAGPRAAAMPELCFESSLPKMTPPRTTEIDVPMLRTKPKVAVAVAISEG